MSNTECSNSDTILHRSIQQKAKFQCVKHTSATNVSKKFLTFGGHANISSSRKYEKYLTYNNKQLDDKTLTREFCSQRSSSADVWLFLKSFYDLKIFLWDLSHYIWKI